MFTRMFDGRVLDMLEVGVEEIRSMAEFEVSLISHAASPPVSTTLVLIERFMTSGSRIHARHLLQLSVVLV